LLVLLFFRINYDNCMTKYDYFIAGRWRNYENVKAALDVVRAAGKTAYCFIENHYTGEKVEFDPLAVGEGDIESTMSSLEGLSLDDPMVRKIFENDITGEREAINFVLILPAGISGHIEAGIAYGLGKRCYAIGQPEKTETLYSVFEKIFPDLRSFEDWLDKQSEGKNSNVVNKNN
jgi:hypothetical protein